MKILAVDTSSFVASACLLNGKKTLYTEDSNKITHSEKLLKLIDNLMVQSSLKVQDLDYIMVINGPGSFTGARIGVVTIKGLAITNNTKIIAVTSLEAMAISHYLSLNTDEEKIICALLDAKNSRAYYGLFKLEKKNGKVKSSPLLEISNDTIDEIKNKLYNLTDVSVVTDIPDVIKEDFEKEYLKVVNKKYTPNASSLITFFQNAEKETINKYETDSYALDIVYARQSQAERMKNGEKD